jgi:hypothetical protein
MKMFATLTSIICCCFAGCTIPCNIYFINHSGETVRLKASLLNRERFNKLPNKVNFYDTAQKKRLFTGDWRTTQLVTWKDSVNFFIDVPAHTVIDIADISNGLTLGSKAPGILLVIEKNSTTDTILSGDYLSVSKKFAFKNSFFNKPSYSYSIH